MKYITTSLLVIFLLMVTENSFAQVNPGDGNVANNIPIDGGAGLLAAAGVAYGVKKYRDYRKGSAEDAEETE